MAQTHTHYSVDKTEPFWWGLFAAGGGIAAMMAPAHILAQGVLGALGLPVATARYGRARKLAGNPLVRLYLFALTVLPIFHFAHRFRYYLMDFGVMGARRPIALAFYGGAILSALGATRTLLTKPRQAE